MNNILVIPDLHAPFIHPKALKHCIKQYKRFKCNKVVFLGDIIDNAATTRWESNPDGYSPGDELKQAIKQLSQWYAAFPKATVIIGNHERRVAKKLKRGAVSSHWLKSFNEVLNVPNWEFVEDYELDGVRYIHGEGCSSTMQSVLQSTTSLVFGHWHKKLEITYNQHKFGMCAGCLTDETTYAFEYGRTYINKQILGCAVVLDNGKLPILCPLQ